MLFFVAVVAEDVIGTDKGVIVGVVTIAAGFKAPKTLLPLCHCFDKTYPFLSFWSSGFLAFISPWL